MTKYHVFAMLLIFTIGAIVSFPKIAVADSSMNVDCMCSFPNGIIEGVSELWICYPLTEEETHQSE